MDCGGVDLTHVALAGGSSMDDTVQAIFFLFEEL